MNGSGRKLKMVDETVFHQHRYQTRTKRILKSMAEHRWECPGCKVGPSFGQQMTFLQVLVILISLTSPTI